MVSGSGRTAAQHMEMLFAKGIVFTLVGAGLLTGIALYAQSTREFLRTSVVVPGRVIKLNAGPHHPEIAFTTLAGEHVEYPQGGEVSEQDGATVEVRYAPDAPAMTARLNTFGAIWGDADLRRDGRRLFGAGVGHLWTGAHVAQRASAGRALTRKPATGRKARRSQIRRRRLRSRPARARSCRDRHGRRATRRNDCSAAP